MRKRIHYNLKTLKYSKLHPHLTYIINCGLAQEIDTIKHLFCSISKPDIS